MKHPGLLIIFFFIGINSALIAQDVTINVDTVSNKCDHGVFNLSFTVTPLPANITSVRWNFGSGIAPNDSGISPTVEYLNGGIDTVKVKINNSLTGVTTVKVLPCLEVPNVFTPNGNAAHNELKIIYRGDGLISFKVFTRYGIMILSTEGQNITWDGRLESGDQVSAGIYYYVIEGVGTSIPISKKGFFYVFYL